MNIEAITQMLIDNEGMILHEYKDHLGYSTIGVVMLTALDQWAKCVNSLNLPRIQTVP